MLKVILASSNPAKKEAVINGFKVFFGDISIQTIEVPTGVAAQAIWD